MVFTETEMSSFWWTFITGCQWWNFRQNDIFFSMFPWPAWGHHGNGKPRMMTSSNGNIFCVTGPLCGEFTGPVNSHTQRSVTRSFDVFFDLRVNKRMSKQQWGWWFETPSWSLWRHRNDVSAMWETASSWTDTKMRYCNLPMLLFWFWLCFVFFVGFGHVLKHVTKTHKENKAESAFIHFSLVCRLSVSLNRFFAFWIMVVSC